MSGPKHLWSGDWQRESEAASSSRAHRAPQQAEPEPPTEKIPPRRPRRQLKRPRLSGTGLIVAAAVLVLAGVAFGLSALLSGSSPRPRHVASATSPGATTIPGAPAVPTLPMPTAPPAQTSPQTQTTPQTQTQTSQPTAATPMVNWLGMQIATQPPGAAVIQTVQIGSPADRAGINPGETIEAVNGRPINSAQDIAAAVKGLGPGSRVTLQLAYGSGTSEAELTLGAPPSVAP
jgi:membrane-associated protease RseP (regulator of RpoE activity)